MVRPGHVGLVWCLTDDVIQYIMYHTRLYLYLTLYLSYLPSDTGEAVVPLSDGHIIFLTENRGIAFAGPGTIPTRTASPNHHGLHLLFSDVEGRPH